jgi:3-dehydroquinate dehydratase/shikimate dehydrogenase
LSNGTAGRDRDRPDDGRTDCHAQRATRGDIVELRLDGVSDVDVAQALHQRARPVIVTVRAAWEGGAFDGGEETRRALLRQALEAGAEYVDVEWRAGFADLIALDPRRIVVSSHDFQSVPSDLAARAVAMRQTGAGTIKIAIPATRLSDALPLLPIAAEGDAVVIAMGDAGVPSRLLASRFGSRWTYSGNAVAPGQIPAARMLGEFRFRSVGPGTRIYGVVGNVGLHSMSPRMHNAAFAQRGSTRSMCRCAPLISRTF